MKELSIKKKAKRYDEAIERAKKWCNAPNANKIPTYANRIIEELFPELKESEDDRIRKWLIGYFQRNKIAENIKTHDILAWLEKQGEKFQYWKPSEEQLEALDYAYNSCPDTERGNYYEGVLGTIIDDLHKLSEKQGEQKSVEWSEEDERLCSCIIEEQEESLDNVKNSKYGHSEIISDLKEMYRERIDWLKTLKQRLRE